MVHTDNNWYAGTIDQVHDLLKAIHNHGLPAEVDAALMHYFKGYHGMINRPEIRVPALAQSRGMYVEIHMVI